MTHRRPVTSAPFNQAGRPTGWLAGWLLCAGHIMEATPGPSLARETASLKPRLRPCDFDASLANARVQLRRRARRAPEPPSHQLGWQACKQLGERAAGRPKEACTHNNQHHFWAGKI